MEAISKGDSWEVTSAGLTVLIDAKTGAVKDAYVLNLEQVRPNR